MRNQGAGPVPKAVMRKCGELREALAKMAETESRSECTRCDGLGVWDDNPNWRTVAFQNKSGKVCFRCHGCGLEPLRKAVDPLTVRRQVVGLLVPLVEAGNVDGVLALKRGHKTGRYWTVLEDAFERAVKAAAFASRVRPGLPNFGDHPPRGRGSRFSDSQDRLLSALNTHSAAVLYKHHPDASNEDVAEALGGFANFSGDIAFYESDN